MKTNILPATSLKNRATSLKNHLLRSIGQDCDQKENGSCQFHILLKELCYILDKGLFSQTPKKKRLKNLKRFLPKNNNEYYFVNFYI